MFRKDKKHPWTLIVHGRFYALYPLYTFYSIYLFYKSSYQRHINRSFNGAR